MACEELRTTNPSDPEAIEDKARAIYEDYISLLSPKEVRLLSAPPFCMSPCCVYVSPYPHLVSSGFCSSSSMSWEKYFSGTGLIQTLVVISFMKLLESVQWPLLQGLIARRQYFSMMNVMTWLPNCESACSSIGNIPAGDTETDKILCETLFMLFTRGCSSTGPVHFYWSPKSEQPIPKGTCY